MTNTKKHAKVLGMLCLIALLLCVFSFGQTVNAASDSYESLTVEIPYKHVYTTTDTEVDDNFHYLVTAKDGAPLPKETDSKGTFAFKGVDGTGEKVEKGTLFVLDGKLTFTFTKPGVYEYTLTADEKADADKKANEFYTLEPREFKITCYIVNDPKGGMKLTMLTSEKEGEKTVDIELDPSYYAPEEEPEPTPEPPDDTPDTGDYSNPMLYTVILTVSAATFIAVAMIPTKKKGSELR